MIPAVKSLIYNTTVDEVYLLIEDDKFPHLMPDFVKTINISNQQFFPDDGPNMDSWFTYMALIRGALHRIFPDLDRILSLDVDTIFIQPCSEIWDFDLGDEYYFAAVREPKCCVQNLLYCNAGVSLYNLKLLRESGKGDEVIDVLNRRKYPNDIQDVYSFLCQGHILEIPSMYNVNNFAEPTVEKKIAHYAGYSDWTRKQEFVKYNIMSWEDVLVRR